MLNPNYNKEEADRINTKLMALPEYELIRKSVEDLRSIESSILNYTNQINALQVVIKDCEGGADECKVSIKELLESIESQSGFSKAPGLAHLATVAANYSVTNPDAVPPEYIVQKITSSVDKVKLKKAIKSGEIDPTQTNWLEVRPEYKTLVLEK